MITYNPKDWFRLIFQFHSSDTFRILLPTLILLGAATGGVVFLQQNGHAHLRTSTVFHQILGFALSMLLVFRINTAYERWWEGRRLWGSLVNNSRSLMAKLHAFISTKAPSELALLRSAIAVFPSILRDHLRDIAFEVPHTEVFPSNREEYLQADNKPLYAYYQIVQQVEKLRESKVISEEQALSINPEIFSLIDITGACERIKNSPIPFSYSLFLKKSLFVYIITMPIPFSTEFGYWAILAVMVIFYTFASLELVSEEVEEPFGTEANDLPTDELSEMIYSNIMSIGNPARSAT